MDRGNNIRRAIYSYLDVFFSKWLPYSLPFVIMMAAYADYKGWKSDDVL